MAVTSSYYLNAPSLGSATAVFSNTELTVKAADGWYYDGEIVRQQVSGVLLPQQNCGGDYIPINISVVSATGAGTCALPLDQVCYNDPVGGSPGIIGIGDSVFSSFCVESPLADGYYNATGSLVGTNVSWFHCTGGIVDQIGFCNQCYEYRISTLTSAGATYIDCTGGESYINIGDASGYDEATFCALYGSVNPYGSVQSLDISGECTIG